MTSDQMDASVEPADDIVVVPDEAARRVVPADEAARALGRLAAEVFADGEVGVLCSQLLELVTGLLPDCDAASIVVRNGGTLESVACSHGVAHEADEAQHRLQEGPALVATGDDGPACVDGRASARWPAFAAAATELGVRGSASHRLALCAAEAGPRWGALNLYSFEGHPFTAGERPVVALLAAHAGLLLSAADERRTAYQRERDLHRALASRDVIGQAKGVLMERQGLSPEQAFDVLRRASMRMNVKLRELAERVIQGDVTGI